MVYSSSIIIYIIIVLVYYIYISIINTSRYIIIYIIYILLYFMAPSDRIFIFRIFIFRQHFTLVFTKCSKIANAKIDSKKNKNQDHKKMIVVVSDDIKRYYVWMAGVP